MGIPMQDCQIDVIFGSSIYLSSLNVYPSPLQPTGSPFLANFRVHLMTCIISGEDAGH